MQDLEFWFAKARLPIIIENKALNSRGISINNQDIFQMSISTKVKKKEEFFRIYLGHKQNKIRIIDANEKLQQVILLVHEPPRDFIVKRYDRNIKKWVDENQRASEFLRKYLMGMDECHLFICELPNDGGVVNKVKDAHRVLKPALVIKQQKSTNRIKRQGEWFFIPASFEELKEIEQNQQFIMKRCSLDGDINRNRNAHIADQLINIKDKSFVNGKIKHREHKTLKLHGWFSIIRNTEPFNRSNNLNRIYGWID